MAGSRTHWFSDSNLTEQTSELSGDNLSRAKALRLKPGELIVVTDGLGAEAQCEIIQSNSQRCNFIQRAWHRHPKPAERQIVQALIRHNPVEEALRLVTEFGATRFVPWRAQRSVLSWDGEKSDRQLRRLSVIAQEQSLLNQIPWFVQVHDLVSELPKPNGLGLLLAAEAGTQLSELLTSRNLLHQLPETPITIVVGPEGGMTEAEIAAAEELGYQAVSLGRVSYRSVSAGAAALALIAARVAAS